MSEPKHGDREFVVLRPEGISEGLSDGAPLMCGACGGWKATHVYRVYFEDEWVEVVYCAACALAGEMARLTRSDEAGR